MAACPTKQFFLRLLVSLSCVHFYVSGLGFLGAGYSISGSGFFLQLFDEWASSLPVKKSVLSEQRVAPTKTRAPLRREIGRKTEKSLFLQNHLGSSLPDSAVHLFVIN